MKITRILSGVLISFGMVISLYLLLRHFNLAGIGNDVDICRALFDSGCDAALGSVMSEQFGIPMAGWGVIYYGMLASLLMMTHGLGIGFRDEGLAAAFLLGLIGGTASIALVAFMVFNVSLFCPLCAIIHLINVVLVFVLKRRTEYSLAELFRRYRSAVVYILTGKTVDPLRSRRTIVAFLVTILLGLGLYQWIRIEQAMSLIMELASFDPAMILARFDSTSVQNIPVREDDAILGKPDAPVQFVIFSDFQCVSCRTMAGSMMELLLRFPGKIRIVSKDFPLGKECNPSITGEAHPLACEAAFAAEAARRQGKYWEFYSALFRTDRLLSIDDLRQLAEILGLDLQRFVADAKSAEVQTKVRSDVELALRLGIAGTPTVFLNGRKLTDLQPRVLQLLVAAHLRQFASHTNSKE